MSTFKRPLLTLGLVPVTALAAQAHTLRVLVNRAVVEPGKKVTVYLSYGHLLPVDELIDAEAVSSLQLHTPTGSVKPCGPPASHSTPTRSSSTRSAVSAGHRPEAVGLLHLYRTRRASRRSPGCPRTSSSFRKGGKFVLATKGHQYSKALILCGEASAQSPARSATSWRSWWRA